MNPLRALRPAGRTSQYTRLGLISMLTSLLALATPTAQAARFAPRGMDPAATGALDAMRIIDINGYRFDPLVQEPNVPAHLRAEWPDPLRGGYYLLQFKERVSVEMKHDVEAAGVALLHYVHHNAFIIRVGGAAALERGRQVPAVRWIGPFHPAYKLSRRLDVAEDAVVQQDLDSRLKRRDASFAPRVDTRLRIQVQIMVMEPSQISAVSDAVKSAGGSDVAAGRGRFGGIRAEVPRGVLERLAKQSGVLWIDRQYPRFPVNDIARWVIQGNNSTTFATPIHDHGLHGTGQLVTIGDTGIDYSHDMFEDPNMPIPPVSPPPPTQSQHRKIVAYYVPPNATGDSSDNGPDDHGTHTSGTVAGDAGTWHFYDGLPDGLSEQAGPHDGQAFDAMIQVQDLSNDGEFIYIPDVLDDMFNPAMAAGSFIHTNSWGACCPYSYHPISAQFDDVTWRNKDLLLLFAAGNFGPPPPPHHINAEAIAKNVIAIGASGNGLAAGSVAAFSSRGPVTNSGRIKPDVMAPGIGIWSAEGCDGRAGCSDDRYWQLSGTSMATPTAAGLATLVRQYFYDGWYPSGTRQPGLGPMPVS